MDEEEWKTEGRFPDCLTVCLTNTFLSYPQGERVSHIQHVQLECVSVLNLIVQYYLINKEEGD